MTPMTRKEKAVLVSGGGPGRDSSHRVRGSLTPQRRNRPNINRNEPDKLRSTICQILDPVDFRKVGVQGLD